MPFMSDSGTGGVLAYWYRLCSKPAALSPTPPTRKTSITAQPSALAGTSTCTATASTASCSDVIVVGSRYHSR